MAIIFKTLTLKNFLSTGQVTQTINFDRQALTLVLGVNEDLGGNDAGSRNGAGKTAAIQALSYALFGVPINQIKKDNLINRTNGKHMLVTLDFEVNGASFRIERGRKPNVLRFYENDKLQDDSIDTAQGENARTQEMIDSIIGMNAELFTHIVALNTYSEPFLVMKTNAQRQIIEQLLGITLLSEKAEAVKELIKNSRDAITAEEIRIRADEESNRRVREQIDALLRRQALWTKARNEEIQRLETELTGLSAIDIEAELAAHAALAQWNAEVEHERVRNSLLARQTAWATKISSDIATLQKQLSGLTKIDIDAELRAHRDLATYSEQTRMQTAWTTKIEGLRKQIAGEHKTSTKLMSEITTLKEHRCYACGQEFHDAGHAEVLSAKVTAYNESQSSLNDLNYQLDELAANPVTVIDRPTTHYATETEAIKHSSEVEKIKQQIADKTAEEDPYSEQLAEYPPIVICPKPVTHYDTAAEAAKHSSRIESTMSALQRKLDEVDPYDEQIAEMRDKALVDISFDRVNDLTVRLDHQKFLLDLLTNKDSFVRKRIIDQNLQFLNGRLTYYLDKIGLPHQVVFLSDLSVQITELGRDLDYCNLSRGEANRVILALSFAFRDVWENLYQPVNALFIDELVDSGMDTVGMENAIGLLKTMSRERGKCVWLISHRDDLASRASNVLRVIKQGGFTEYLDEGI